MSGNAFLAVALSDVERHALSAALSTASPGSKVPGRRPPPENWHITLRFLGQCSDAEADRVAHAVEENLSTGPGRVFVTGIGAFPRPSKASVLYAAIDDHEGLLEYVAGICEEAAREVGFEPEERPFVPHLTLSRLRPPSDLHRLIDAFAPLHVPISVETVTLYRSIPSRSGITYDPIHTIPLTP